MLIASMIASLLGNAWSSEAQADNPPATVEVSRFGEMPDGTEVRLFTLSNGKGLEANVMTLGATLTTVKAQDRDGNAEAITLSKDALDGYLAGHPMLGSVIGRFANRIAGASFSINGTSHRLIANEGENHIHGGGQEGFAWKVWEAEPIQGEGFSGVKLSLTSPDGEAGYPGTVQVDVTYMITTDNMIIMEYNATTDQPTHINLTNHAYWNLAGADNQGDVLGHIVELRASHYLPTDDALIPTGEVRPVEGTPLDFQEPMPIGSRVHQLDPPRYDHCFVIDRDAEIAGPTLAAKVFEPTSGRSMEVFTTQPGVQFYTGNPLGFCLETQHYPDAPNHPDFPSTLLRPGETFRQVTIHKFGVEQAR
ncbi:galactose mutarotase [soil metagenome]